jgi:hypothetical protein
MCKGQARESKLGKEGEAVSGRAKVAVSRQSTLRLRHQAHLSVFEDRTTPVRTRTTRCVKWCQCLLPWVHGPEQGLIPQDHML